MIRYIFLLYFLSFHLHATEAEPLPRAYGYVIGDILDQRVALTKDGVTVDLLQTPIEQRVGPWVQRLTAEITLDEQGESWLDMRYQIVNSPFEPQELALPSLALPTTSGDTFNVVAQSFSLMPLTLERTAESNNLPFMHPDYVPAFASDIAARQRLRFAIFALCVTALVWLGWWLWQRQQDKTTLPFSIAMHLLSGLRKNKQISVNDNKEAWSAVHEALNTLAGQTLSSRTAVAQLKHHDWLKPHSADIESFYKISDQRFFKPDSPPAPFELYEFCKKICKVEKRNSANIKTGKVSVS